MASWPASRTLLGLVGVVLGVGFPCCCLCIGVTQVAWRPLAARVGCWVTFATVTVQDLTVPQFGRPGPHARVCMGTGVLDMQWIKAVAAFAVMATLAAPAVAQEAQGVQGTLLSVSAEGK